MWKIYKERNKFSYKGNHGCKEKDSVQSSLNAHSFWVTLCNPVYKKKI